MRVIEFMSALHKKYNSFSCEPNLEFDNGILIILDPVVQN